MYQNQNKKLVPKGIVPNLVPKYQNNLTPPQIQLRYLFVPPMIVGSLLPDKEIISKKIN